MSLYFLGGVGDKKKGEIPFEQTYSPVVETRVFGGRRLMFVDLRFCSSYLSLVMRD